MQPLDLRPRPDVIVAFMKIIRNTPEQLILSYVPWLTGLFLIGILIVFLAAGLSELGKADKKIAEIAYALLMPVVVFGILFWGLVQRIQIIMDRPHDKLTIRRRTLMGHQVNSFKLSDFRCSEMQPSRFGGHNKTYRPVLYFVHVDGTSIVPLFTGYSNWSRRMHRAVDAMNEWHQAHPVDSAANTT
ncbi:MAG: hypothetical protein AB3N22_10685 [Ruegeria sp.]